MIKKLTRTGKIIVHPADSEGASKVTVVAQEFKEVEIDLCVDYDGAMRILSDILMEHQIRDMRGRLYKN